MCVRWPTLAACVVDCHGHDAECTAQLRRWVQRRADWAEESRQRLQPTAVDGQVATFLAQCVSLLSSDDPTAVASETLLC